MSKRSKRETATKKKRVRGQGEGTIAKRMVNGVWDGTWWARITVGKDDNGKQKRKAFYGKTREEVQKKLTAALNDYNNGTYIEPSEMTVGEWLDIWLKVYKRNSLSMVTYVGYVSSFRNYINPALGNIKLKNIRNDMIQRAINEWHKKLYVSTIQSLASRVLKPAFRQAVINGLIAKNPTDGIMMPKEKATQVKALSLEEQERFIEAAKKSYLGEMFILALATGLRRGELTALTWDDIDFEKRILKVTKNFAHAKDPDDANSTRIYYIKEPKTKAGNRIVPLLPDIVTMLEAYKKKQDEAKLKFGENYNKNNFVFCNRLTGDFIRSSTIQYSFGIIKRKANIDNIHVHCLRHTFATRGLENDIELKVMQELLGHSSIKMTADIYTHVLPEKKQDSVMKLASVIKI